MPSNVRSITHRTESGRFLAAAQVIRDTDALDAADVANLVEAVGQALHTLDDPPLTELEMLRWSSTVHWARVIVSKFVPR